jgi:hypothetical protein
MEDKLFSGPSSGEVQPGVSGAQTVWRPAVPAIKPTAMTNKIKDRPTRASMGFANFFLLRFGGILDLLDVFGRVLVKIRPAGLATQFHFLAFVNEDNRRRHFTQLVAGNRAGGQFIRLGRRFRLGIIGGNRPSGARKRGGNQKSLYEFHELILCCLAYKSKSAAFLSAFTPERAKPRKINSPRRRRPHKNRVIRLPAGYNGIEQGCRRR